MTNRSTFLLVAIVAATLWGCGSVSTVAGDGGADQVADLDAPPSETNAENPSDGGASEVVPEVGPDAPAIPTCAAIPRPSPDACPGGPACAQCLGANFAWLAAPGAPCRAGETICVVDCSDCP